MTRLENRRQFLGNSKAVAALGRVRREGAREQLQRHISKASRAKAEVDLAWERLRLARENQDGALQAGEQDISALIELESQIRVARTSLEDAARVYSRAEERRKASGRLFKISE